MDIEEGQLRQNSVWACTSVLACPRLVSSGGGMTEELTSDCAQHNTLSNESMEEAELTDTPEAKATE